MLSLKATTARRVALGRASVRAPAVRPAVRRNALAKDQDPTEKVQQTFYEAVDAVKAAWEKTDDKPAVVITTTAGVVALFAASSVVNAVDRIPIVSGLFELAGLAVTAWFAYKLVTSTSDREEITASVQKLIKQVYGGSK